MAHVEISGICRRVAKVPEAVREPLPTAVLSPASSVGRRRPRYPKVFGTRRVLGSPCNICTCMKPRACDSLETRFSMHFMMHAVKMASRQSCKCWQSFCKTFQNLNIRLGFTDWLCSLSNFQLTGCDLSTNRLLFVCFEVNVCRLEFHTVPSATRHRWAQVPDTCILQYRHIPLYYATLRLRMRCMWVRFPLAPCALEGRRDGGSEGGREECMNPPQCSFLIQILDTIASLQVPGVSQLLPPQCS